MLAVQKVRPGPGLLLAEVPDLFQPGPGEVLLAVAACGVCGSDVHIAEWHGGYDFVAPHLPLTLGHEFAGRVLAAGPGVDAPRTGDRVVVVPGVVCGVCDACRAGRPDDCTRRRSIGMTLPGGAAAQVLVPARQCLPVPDGLDLELAALAEPLGIGLSAVDTAGLRGGERVLVLGPGTIGQAIALMARRAGAREVVVAGQDDGPRLDAVRALGFPQAVDLAGRPLAEALAAAGAAAPFDTVFEATGVPEVVQAGLGVLRTGGVLVVTGIHPRPALVDLTGMVRRRHQIRASYRATFAMWRDVLGFLAAEGERVRPMISHRLPLVDALRGFDLAASRAASKVLLLPTPDPEPAT